VERHLKLIAADRPITASTALYPSYPLTSSSTAAIAHMPVTVIHAIRARGMAPILSSMAANANELALRYLLQLSSDIAAAMLFTEDGELLATAPDLSGEPAAPARDLMRATLELRNGQEEAIELDALCERDSVFVLASHGLAMVCVASRLALPGIVLHEMRSVLSDLARGSEPVAREAGA
jgi:hypothetical protein